MNAVDTNILIYSIDANDDAKRQRALELLESLGSDDTIIPWQVACEVGAVLQTMQRMGRFQGEYDKTVNALRSCFPIAMPTAAVLDRSLSIQLNQQVALWDALLIAACAEAGVDRLYTEDMQSSTTIDGVELVNPFIK